MVTATGAMVRGVVAVLGTSDRPYALTEQQLVFLREVTYEQWLASTEELLTAAKGVQFWVADALAYGAVAPERHNPQLNSAHHATGPTVPPNLQVWYGHSRS